jgi:hypothetical protein
MRELHGPIVLRCHESEPEIHHHLAAALGMASGLEVVLSEGLEPPMIATV